MQGKSLPFWNKFLLQPSLNQAGYGDISGLQLPLQIIAPHPRSVGCCSYGLHHCCLCPHEAAVGQSSETRIGLTAASALAACCKEMNNACSTFKWNVTECFQGENLLLLTLPAWEEHPCWIPCSEGLNLDLQPRRVWVSAVPISLWAALQAEGLSWGWGTLLQSPTLDILAKAGNSP